MSQSRARYIYKARRALNLALNTATSTQQSEYLARALNALTDAQEWERMGMPNFVTCAIHAALTGVEMSRAVRLAELSLTA